MLNFNLGYDPYSYDEEEKNQRPTLLAMIATARRVMTLRALYSAFLNMARLAVHAIPGATWFAITRLVMRVDPMKIMDPSHLLAKYGSKIPHTYHWIFPLMFIIVGVLDMCTMGLMVLAQQYIIWFIFKRQKLVIKHNPQDPQDPRRAKPRRPRGPTQF